MPPKIRRRIGEGVTVRPKMAETARALNSLPVGSGVLSLNGRIWQNFRTEDGDILWSNTDPDVDLVIDSATLLDLNRNLPLTVILYAKGI